MVPVHDLEVLLFDLGGVIVELSGLPQWAEWTGGRSRDEELWRRWLCSPSVRAFESGRCTPEDFAVRLVAEFDLPLEPTEFLAAFAAWPRGPYAGALELLRQLQSRPFRLACFSNTNSLHWPRFLDEMELRHHFDAHFASHELGVLKPDVEAFREVTRRLGCPPRGILFLDDNTLNVDGARRAGLRAECVSGVEGARQRLHQLGLLSGEAERSSISTR